MKKLVRIGLFGLGTVGKGVVDYLSTHQEHIFQTFGLRFEIIGALVREAETVNNHFSFPLYTDKQKLLQDNTLDIIIEVMGGTSFAKEVVIQALQNNKAVVTANKALLAECAEEVFGTVMQTKTPFFYEASVGGGIPVIRALQQSLSGEPVIQVSGILNGTANYILTTMLQEGKDFAQVLQQAQDLGYAEADPSFDIDGKDTAHKLSILLSLLYKGIVPLETLHIEGIRDMSINDLKYAQDLGYAVRLIAQAQKKQNSIEACVHPALVSMENSLYNIQGVNNAVVFQGTSMGDILLSGAGAGGLPTASAIVADLINYANQTYQEASFSLEKISLADFEEIEQSFYVKIETINEPAIFESILQQAEKQGILPTEVRQYPLGKDKIHYVFLTNAIKEKTIQEFKKNISKLEKINQVYRLSLFF